jgi:putative flippase GtrA
VQLALLQSLTVAHWPDAAADVMALLVSTQVNFVLSYIFTWGDRRSPGFDGPDVLKRWVGYQSMVAAAFVVNLAVFLVARMDFQQVVASAFGTMAGAGLNYVTGNHLVFAAHL